MLTSQIESLRPKESHEKLSRNDVILITGSTRGIGGAAATLFAENGATVIFHGREKEERANKRVKELVTRGLNGSNLPIVMQDLSKPEAVRQLYHKVQTALPGRTITGLFNNVAIGMEKMLETLPEEEREKHVRRVNVEAQIEAIKVGYEMGMIADGATIVYITSNHARNWTPNFDLKPYSQNLQEFLRTYNRWVASFKNEAERQLMQPEILDLIHSHKGRLLVLTAGIVAGTPAEAGLKLKHVWDEAIIKFGYTNLARMAEFALHVYINKNIQSGSVITVPDLPP